MKARDVRIGNLLYSNGVVVTIDGRSIFDMWSYNLDLTRANPYEPIPLNEDWIESFGFRKISLSLRSWMLPSTGRYELRNVTALEGGFKIHAMKDRYLLSNKIEYVHTLQNLHFAITSEDLTKVI